MNYALIFAGGVGRRMNNDATPKQFMEIKGKPILIHTIEHFEKHPEIDGICLVCVNEWLDYAAELMKRFQIRKVRWLVPGGASALDSQYIGLKAIQSSHGYQNEDIVLIHDGVRPLINERLVSECIACVKQHGAAVTVAPAIETILQTDCEGGVQTTIPRTECMLARAPQAFFAGQIIELHETSLAEGKHDFIDSVSMLIHYDKPVYTVLGPAENIKVTTPTDFYSCRALLEAL